MAEKLTTNLLGRTAVFRDPIKDAPEGAWSTRARAGTRAEVVGVERAGHGTLHLVLLWEDTGELETIASEYIRILIGNEV